MNFLRYVFKAVNYTSKYHLNSPRVKGFIGEKQVNSVLNEEHYKLHNILIGTNRQAQIDHIVISNKGIIVIETKNYRGLIKGNIGDQYWIQYINNKQYLFLNPIVQNNYHIKVLNEHFPEYEEYFLSVIVFTKNAKLILNNNTGIIYVDELSNYIKSLPDTGFTSEKQKWLFEYLGELKKNQNSEDSIVLY